MTRKPCYLKAMRIAHCSDLHLLSLQGARILDFANKRWIGRLNLLTNRGRHYHTSAFEAMVADFNASDVDHVICTGDVTNLALEQEFRFARTLFDQIELGPHRVTVIPGNHDAYIAKGNQYFTQYFADYFKADAEWERPADETSARSGHRAAPDDPTWPVVRIRGNVALIGLSTSMQTPWFTAYGRLGTAQLDRLRAVLADRRLASCLRLVAIHHPPVGKSAHNKIRGLRDFAAFARVIAESGAELVIHGHEHRDLRGELPGPNGDIVPVLGVQSGTYEANRPERTARYRIFEIAGSADEKRPGVVAHRLRRWNSVDGQFVDDLAEPSKVTPQARITAENC
ncbi:MAG: metallophosphoesterase [Proteobacteria bacterium]|nr:metallophosphoesterase [Pseudomonadota bacterium]